MQVNISVNFLFLIVGLLVSSAVPTLSLMLFWKRIPAGACIASTLGGQASAIIAWVSPNLAKAQLLHASEYSPAHVPVSLLVSSAVPSLSLMLFWKRIPAGACIASTLGGQASAIIAWRRLEVSVHLAMYASSLGGLRFINAKSWACTDVADHASLHDLQVEVHCIGL